MPSRVLQSPFVESTAVTPELVIRAVLELLFLLAVIIVLLTLSDFRRRLFALGAAALTVFYIFIGGWSVVQMVDRWQYDYPQDVSFIPLTRFAMYQAQLESSVEASYAWQATLADGSERDVNIAKEFESVGLPPMSTRMRVLLGWAHDPEDDQQHADAARELELYAEGLYGALSADGLEVEELSFSRVTGTPDDVDAEVLFTWSAEELSAR